jgi:hypothetical protein
VFLVYTIGKKNSVGAYFIPYQGKSITMPVNRHIHLLIILYVKEAIKARFNETCVQLNTAASLKPKAKSKKPKAFSAFGSCYLMLEFVFLLVTGNFSPFRGLGG